MTYFCRLSLNTESTAS